MTQEYLFRAAILACLLITGSCSVDSGRISEDGAANHPIQVQPHSRDLKLAVAEAASPQDAAELDAFLAEYRAHGNGSLAISVPDGAAGRALLRLLAERAVASGISPDKILVATHGLEDGDDRVDVNFITYAATADGCGDWSEDLAFTADNLTAKNFGCAVQHNIAAMVADPRDLVAPRSLARGDGARAATVLDNYQQGKPTAAQKTADQSGAVSDVNRQ